MAGGAQMAQLKEHLGRTLESAAQVMGKSPQEAAEAPEKPLDATLSGGTGSRGGDLDELRAGASGQGAAPFSPIDVSSKALNCCAGALKLLALPPLRHASCSRLPLPDACSYFSGVRLSLPVLLSPPIML